MGSSSSTNNADHADIQTIKTQVASLNDKLSNYDTVKQAALNPSTNIKVDYDALGSKLSTPSAMDGIAKAVVNQGTKLTDAIVPAMAKDAAIQNTIQTSITNNSNFVKTVAGELVTNADYRKQITGPQGIAGDISNYEALKSNLFTNALKKGTGTADHGATVWCADGDLCLLPQGIKGFDRVEIPSGVLSLGDTRMAGNKDDWVRLLADPNNLDSYNKGVAAKNLWAKEKLWVANKDILGELDGLNQNIKNTSDNIKKNTTWCADGEICKIPAGKKGIDWGYGGSKIYDDGNLHITTDDQLHLDAPDQVFLPATTALQFGNGFDREANAGKIAYGRFDGGQDGTLNIVGGGKNGQARVVRVWDALRIGDTHLRQDDDWLRLIGDKNNPGDYNKGLAAKNLWARDVVYAPKLVIGQWQFQQHPNGNLHIHRGDINNWSLALTPDDNGNFIAKGNFRSERWNKWL